MFAKGGASKTALFANSQRSIGSSQVQKKTKLSMFNQKAKGSGEDKNTFHYPVTIYPGMPIGLYEVCFDRKSAFLYKFNADVEGSEGFFIRNKRWKAIKEKVSSKILAQFKRRVVHEFATKVHIPIHRH
mmetsp:Transcript_24714/g.38479  ORF Transcript_24714/g.38479 Transcript_24714/m.38479 type:complete len:129 (+) Transcript_24714:1637-2023(+)